MSDVFISYAHEDQPFVRRMTPALEAEGFSVWWDHTIPPGKTWDEVIAKGIEEARCCIVLWSKHSIGSDWVKEEATIAKDNRKFLPAQIDDVQPPVGFRRIQAAHLKNWAGDVRDPQWVMLVNEVHNIVSASRAGGGASPAQGAARPAMAAAPQHAPSPAPGFGKWPMIVIGAVAATALIAFLLLRPPGPAPEAPAPAPAEQPQVAETAPPQAGADELERLRRERDELIDTQRQTEQQAEISQLQREREDAQAAAQRATDSAHEQQRLASPSGTWSGPLNWSGMEPGTNTITLYNDGTARSAYGEGGTWRLSGSNITIQLNGTNADNSDNSAILSGTFYGDAISGTLSTTASSHTGTFDLRRQ